MSKSESRTGDGRIVVGVDRSASARKALSWAAGEARARHLPLDVVFAWEDLGVEVARAGGWVKAVTVDMERAAASEVLDRVIAEVLGAHPDLEVRPVAVPGEGAEALIKASRDAELLVVGARGDGGFDGLRLGSVSEKCTHHSHCPVVVVRDHDG